MADSVSTAPGQTCNIMEIKITSKSGTVYDILDNEAFLSIDIFENLFTYYLTADLMIKDSRDIAKNLPLLGGEEVSFVYEDLQLKKIFQLKFTLFRHSTDGASEGDTAQTTKFIMLKLVSQEGFKSINKRISKCYENSPINIIKSVLLTDLSSSKTVSYDTSPITISINANFWTPSEIINFALNKAGPPPDLIFYETVQGGFNIKSINTLFSQVPSETLHYLRNQNIKNKIDLIDRLEPGIKSDQLRNAKKGVFGGTYFKWNETDNTIQKVEVDYGDIYKQTTPVGNTSNLNEDLYSKTSNVKQSYYNIETHSHRTMLMDSINNNSCKITIPGQMRSAGQLVSILYSNTDFTTEPHDLFSGNWLISEIKHRITNRGGHFEQHIKLIKNAFFGSKAIGKNIDGMKANL